MWKYQIDHWFWWHISLSFDCIDYMQLLKTSGEKTLSEKKNVILLLKTPQYSKKRFLFNRLTFFDNIFDNGKSLLSKANNIYGLTSPSLFWYWSNEIKCFLERLYHTVLEIWILGFYNGFRCTSGLLVLMLTLCLT